ncbi:uncharacterized protein [Amphiura filiformis]|uniref:uncharacterized protein isoform X2 n=1 Tax=Amphiura filiformis TaxID=82378 RepID=UPI003B218EC9
MADKVDVEPTSRVAARRKAREQAAADEAKGAVGGAGSKTPEKGKAKGGRFGKRNTREKRRGTGVVTLQEDDLDKEAEEAKKTAEYNEQIGRQPAADHCGNGCSNGAAAECTNGAVDLCGNGTTETKESPRHRRRDITNSDETESHHNARRRLPEDDSNSSHSTPTSILRRAEARASTDGRSPEEWRRELETAEDELDSVKEENRVLLKAMGSKDS